MKIALSLLALVWQTLAYLQQKPFSTASASAGEFQVYRSTSAPDHRLRIKRQNSTLCETDVDQYTGWLDIGPSHLFFWYFAATSSSDYSKVRHEDDHDIPFALWLNGGPGASSMLGLLEELGPCLINEYGNGTVNNPYAWNKDTALLFVDEPAGVGFSYMDEGAEPIGDSRAAMGSMYTFLQMFITQVMPCHADGALTLLGESYGGHYLPALGTEILRQNLAHPHRQRVPLKSIAIGNGYVSSADTVFGHWETLCTTNPGISEPVFNRTRCDIMAEQLPRCMEVHDVCNKHPDVAICAAVDVACEGVSGLFYSEAFLKDGRNPYDITRTCEAAPFCYPQGPLIESYLNTPSVFSALAVPSEVKNYSMSASGVTASFAKTPDGNLDFLSDVQTLLKAGVDMLIYQGNLDLSCNTAGAKRWTERLSWKGQAEFIAKDLVPWTSSSVDGKQRIVGKTREVNVVVENGNTVRFAFVTVDGAGHMVPQDQPEVALDMLTRWLAGGLFD